MYSEQIHLTESIMLLFLEKVQHVVRYPMLHQLIVKFIFQIGVTKYCIKKGRVELNNKTGMSSTAKENETVSVLHIASAILYLILI